MNANKNGRKDDDDELRQGRRYSGVMRRAELLKAPARMSMTARGGG